MDHKTFALQFKLVDKISETHTRTHTPLHVQTIQKSEFYLRLAVARERKIQHKHQSVPVVNLWRCPFVFKTALTLSTQTGMPHTHTRACFFKLGRVFMLCFKTCPCFSERVMLFVSLLENRSSCMKCLFSLFSCSLMCFSQVVVWPDQTRFHGRNYASFQPLDVSLSQVFVSKATNYTLQRILDPQHPSLFCQMTQWSEACLTIFVHSCNRSKIFDIFLSTGLAT